MWVTVVIALFVVIITVFSWYKERRKFIKSLAPIPGPAAWPIWGNTLDLINPAGRLSKLLEYHEKHGGIIKVWLGGTPNTLLVQDYKFLEFLLSSTSILDKSNAYKYLQRWLGTGLLLSDGDDKWKRHRKILTPAFHFKILEKFPASFEASTQVLVRKLEGEVGKTSTDITSFIKLCTLDIITDSVMGSSINAQENSSSEYVSGVNTMCKIIIERLIFPLLQNSIIYFFSKQHFEERKAIKMLHGFVTKVIKRKEEQLKLNFNMNTTIDDVGEKKRFAFLDLLLFEKLQNHSFTDEEIREEVDTFMFAGHDTTSSALNFCIWCLAENMDVQNKIVEELNDIFFDDKSRFPDYRDLQEMKYLDAVIKETLRLYPPVPFFARNVHEDIVYEGITLPKGVTIIMNVYGLHRSEEYFPNPTVFNPDRFISKNCTTQYPFCYIPFSAGARNCIGQKFAMLVLKSVMSTILRNFEILPATPKHVLEVMPEAVLASHNGVRVRLIKRQF